MPGIGTVLGGFSGFKGRLLLFAGILALIGVGLNSISLLEPENGVSPLRENASSMKTELVGQTRKLAEYSRSSTWGDAAIRLGLSFGVAMIFASLLKAFFRSMITFVLVAVVVCWFLNSRGLIEPFWTEFDFSAAGAREWTEGQLGEWTEGQLGEWTEGQLETVKGFLGGVLPSTGAAAVGFLCGLRK